MEIKQNKTTEHCQKIKKQGNISKGKENPGQYNKADTNIAMSKHAKTGQFKKIDNQAEGKTLF